MGEINKKAKINGRDIIININTTEEKIEPIRIINNKSHGCKGCSRRKKRDRR